MSHRAGTSERTSVIVFTDGAASGNPGPGGWGVVIVTPDDRVIELGGGAPHTTNNRMELTGAIEALQHLSSEPAAVAIYTDSSYVIHGITQWVWNWQRRGWKTAQGGDVLNRELWERLSELARARKGRLSWHWVRGHDGTAGNERVDEIAVAFSRGRTETLYDGPLGAYTPAILDLPDDADVPPRSSARPPANGIPAAAASRSTNARAYSYLSVVDGVLERHATWPECERRVKGRSGARFKKTQDVTDENAILRSWGFEPANDSDGTHSRPERTGDGEARTRT
jgi:ribonuclease HI